MAETYKKRFLTMEEQIRFLTERVIALEDIVNSSYTCYNCGSHAVECVDTTDDSQIYHCSNCGAEITYSVGEYNED